MSSGLFVCEGEGIERGNQEKKSSRRMKYSVIQNYLGSE